MSITYNGTDIKAINYNGTSITKVIYNGTTVWPSTTYVVDGTTVNATIGSKCFEVSEGSIGIINSVTKTGTWTYGSTTIGTGVYCYETVGVANSFVLLQITPKTTIPAGTALKLNINRNGGCSYIQIWNGSISSTTTGVSGTQIYSGSATSGTFSATTVDTNPIVIKARMTGTINQVGIILTSMYYSS